MTNEWREIAPMPTPRYNFTPVSDGKKLYCIGGLWTQSDAMSPDMAIYDLATNSWCLEEIPFRSNYLGTVLVGEKIYCIGGFDDRSTPQSMVYIYDLRTGVWDTGKPLPIPLGGMGCVQYEGKIYCLGGRNERGSNKLNTVYIYDIEADRWSSGKAMPAQRMYFGCTVCGSKIYCLGNSTDSESGYLPMHVFDIEEDTWSSVERDPDHRMAVNVEGITIGRQVHFVTYTEHFLYDTETESWERDTVPPTISQGNIWQASYTYVNGKLYCLGGHLSGMGTVNYAFVRDEGAQTGDCTITTRYHSVEEEELAEPVTDGAVEGGSFTATAKAIDGYTCIGYRIDGGELAGATTAAINPVVGNHTVTFYYRKEETAPPDGGNRCCCGKLRLELELPVSNTAEMLRELRELVEAAKSCDSGCGRSAGE